MGETYAQHLLHAAAFGTRSVMAGAAWLLHAGCSFVFQDAASSAITALHADLKCVARHSAERM